MESVAHKAKFCTGPDTLQQPHWQAIKCMRTHRAIPLDRQTGAGTVDGIDAQVATKSAGHAIKRSVPVDGVVIGLNLLELRQIKAGRAAVAPHNTDAVVKVSVVDAHSSGYRSDNSEASMIRRVNNTMNIQNSMPSTCCSENTADVLRSVGSVCSRILPGAAVQTGTPMNSVGSSGNVVT